MRNLLVVSWRRVLLSQAVLLRTHLIWYAENPEQNEPVSEGGWEQLRWGYERLRESLKEVDYDVIVVLSPHWQTYVGTHFIGVERCASKSVDPVFPNLFRFNYDLNIDVELARAIHDQAESEGMAVKMMENQIYFIFYIKTKVNGLKGKL